ncbi:expressed unknown protein [Seminavis robusta]|uniref:Uncharacterized protein n=1 Tax=Seminavis robusta TaxID=568900 RepID=A0A9N8HYD3_9STRA|nr:expressed unknown protein [Seminavis robusta]|eukprot:Sro3946_g352080.1 n/a (408) ;mRNA; f:2352-3696
MVTVSKKEHHDQQLLPNRQAVIGFYVILFVLLGVLVNSRWLFGSDNNTSSSSGSNTHPSQASGFQRQANTILQHTVDQGLLTTELSQREFVLANGFPSQWQWPPCLLDGILQAKKTTTSELNVAILGGSTSARAAYNCDKYNVGNPVEGRYSNILQQLVRAQENKLQQEESAFRINFQNLAQGSTNSLYSAMHMDTLLLPNETDVVIWDHGPDDDQILTKHNFGGEAEELRRLEFWFTRLKALYGQAGKPPPPIIVLRWWRRTWWSRKTHGPTLDSNQMDYLGPLFSHLQGLGFDIAVVNVGAAIPWTSRFRSKESHRLVSDDGLHPSCSGATFAAQMLEHLLYSNWGNGTESCGGALPSRTIVKQPMKHNNNNVSWSPQDQLLWEDLFREDAKLGSINSWEPKLLM